jgi:hypothetical protein
VDEPRPNDAFDRALRRTLAASGASASGSHVDAELAAAWMERRLDTAAARSVETHLAGCADCQALFATLARIEAEDTAAPGALAWWRRVRTGWLVPATVAAAAALVIWVAVPQQRSANVSEPPSQPRAQSQAAQSSAPPAPAPAAEAEPAADTRSTRSRSEPQAKTAAPVAAPPATSELERRDRLADASAASSIESKKESIVVAGETPPVDAQSMRRAAVAGAASAAAPAAPAAERQEAAAPSRDRLLRENAQFAAGLRGSALTIVAADGAARWRRTGTRVEFAPRADAGFTAAVLPVSADAIVAGASPGGTACWFVGNDGLVLVTSDGLRFARVPAPAATALVGVTAIDARSATVTAADGRRFRTGDAGATWTLEVR